MAALTRSGALLAAALLAAPATARGQGPDGTAVVCGLGWASARLDYENVVERVRFGDGWRGGALLELGVRHRVRPRLFLGARLDAWFGAADTISPAGSAPERRDDWSLTVVGADAAWHPGGGPFFLRAGGGLAHGTVTFADAGGFEQVFRDAGWAARAGCGWAAPVAPGLAVCPALEVQRLDLGSGDGATVVSLTVGLAAR